MTKESNLLFEQIFGAVLGLMLQQAPIADYYQPPPMQYSQPRPPYSRPPPPDGARMVTHNGSLMALSVWPDQTVEIVYSQPKPELFEIGVRPGTLLIRGQWREDRIFAGIAHVFTYCGHLPYAVTGRVDESGALVLQGPAPRVWAGSCIVADYVWTQNSYLRFEPFQ